jgi:hypothetical protein
MDAEKLAGLLGGLIKERYLAMLMFRGGSLPLPVAGVDDWIESVSVHDGLVRVECRCKHGMPDWSVIDPAEVIAVRWQPRGHEHDDDAGRGNIL